MKQRRRRGSAMLEFTLAFAVLAPLTVTATQFILAHVQLAFLQRMVHAGAREGSALPWDSPDEKPSAEFRRKVENVVLYGSVEETGKAPLVLDLGRDQIQLAVEYGEGRPRRISVSIKGYNLFGGGPWKHLDGKPAAAFPYRAR
jgi:hypothetical protein